MKTVKDAVEYYKGVWPEGYERIIVNKEDGNPVFIYKQQFEDYVKEAKMEKQKYKSVPVTNMTIWQLGQAVSEGGEFYCANGHVICASNEYGTISSYQTCQADLNRQLKMRQITTRQPLPWYEVEGVFDNCVLVDFDGYHGVALAERYDKKRDKIIIIGMGAQDPKRCTPLNKEQAAKYGVDHA